MLLKNAQVVNEDFQMEMLDLRICGEKIAEVGADLTAEPGEEQMDLTGCCIMP